MSTNIDTAARVQVGDGADAGAFSVTATAASFTFPKDLRGRYVKLFASVGTAYLSGGHVSARTGVAEVAPTTATAANGFEVATGTPESIFIPTGTGDYKVSILGSEVLTLKYIVVSP